MKKQRPHGDYPLIEVGVLELNRNPENYFAEVEQSAFSPANVVPGIGHSPDRMLQDNGGGSVHYEPNIFGGPVEDPADANGVRAALK